MGKKSSKTPSYATTSYDTGDMFGKSTTSSKGTTFTPTDYMKTAGDTAWNGLNNTLNSLASGDYSQDANYQVYANNLRRQMSQNYDTNVLTPLANRGLMRSSGLQAATNAFGDTLANQTANLYDGYTNRLGNSLSAYQGTLNNLFNYITGVNTGSQNNSNNISSYNLKQYQLNQANSGGGALSGALNGAMMGASTGNPYAILGGAALGGLSGAMNK